MNQRVEEMEKPMDEEDNFHKTLMQKKPKLDRIHKSTPVVSQGEVLDSSKRPPEYFHRTVNSNFSIFAICCKITYLLLRVFCRTRQGHGIIIHSVILNILHQRVHNSLQPELMKKWKLKNPLCHHHTQQ